MLSLRELFQSPKWNYYFKTILSHVLFFKMFIDTEYHYHCTWDICRYSMIITVLQRRKLRQRELVSCKVSQTTSQWLTAWIRIYSFYLSLEFRQLWERFIKFIYRLIRNTIWKPTLQILRVKELLYWITILKFI